MLRGPTVLAVPIWLRYKLHRASLYGGANSDDPSPPTLPAILAPDYPPEHRGPENLSHPRKYQVRLGARVITPHGQKPHHRQQAGFDSCMGQTIVYPLLSPSLHAPHIPNTDFSSNVCLRYLKVFPTTAARLYSATAVMSKIYTA